MRITAFLLSAIAVLPSAFAANVQVLTPTNFDEIVLKSGKPALVEFFAPWCGHCKNLAPVYEELATAFTYATDKVSIASVDADEHKSLGNRFGIKGFPTLKWFDGVSESPVDYTGGRDLESLSKWVTEKTGLKLKKAKEPVSHINFMNDKTFKKEVGGDKSVFVAFTTAWCGHCKKLAPTWEKLASTFSADDNIIIAKIDAEAEDAKTTAQEQGVSGYPTIKFFPAGSKDPEDYNGGRTEDALVEFVNEKTGLSRVPGGGLNAKAGTIDTLDSIIGKISTGATVASVTEEVVAAAKDLKEKYAEYYVKVLAKMASTQGYVEKELARLEKMIKKGGLAPTKSDDLISRANILRMFGQGPKAAKKDEL